MKTGKNRKIQILSCIARQGFPHVFLFLLGMSILLPACSLNRKESAHHPIIGKWISVEPDIRTVYELGEEGKGLWIFEGVGTKDTIRIDYSLVDTLSPKTIEISGFNRGALTGMVLYGIYEVSNDSLKIDFEPGDPGSPRRLKMFRPGETVIFKKMD